MTAVVNNGYIVNLSHTPSNKVKPVHAEAFLNELEKQYGKDKVKAAISWLTSEHTKNAFSGMGAFQDRLISAISSRGIISGDDQKYIADITFRASAGLFNTVGVK
jgi:hypothetical protein